MAITLGDFRRFTSTGTSKSVNGVLQPTNKRASWMGIGRSLQQVLEIRRTPEFHFIGALDRETSGNLLLLFLGFL